MRTSFVARWLCSTATALAALSGGQGAAHAALDAAIDRFEIDGNSAGPLDGTPDLVDEFDDGVLAPAFAGLVGTVSESGGNLHLESPGQSIGVPGLTTYMETSGVTSTSAVLDAGTGDGVYRIVLAPQTLAANHAVNFLLSTLEPTGFYFTGISLVNFNSLLADFYQPPLTPGLAILSHQEVLGGFDNQQISLEHVPISGGAISGPVVLEMRYDDSNGEVTTAYSLDGGAIFAAPFSPMPLESADGTARAYLAATVGPEGTCPAALSIDTARLTGLGRPGKSRARIRAAIGGQRLGYEALRLRLRDDGAGATVIWDVQLPDTLLATPKCDPRDGWRPLSGGASAYLNFSDALPPACLPGSAQGLQAVRIRWTGTNFVQVKIARATLPAIVGPLRFELYRGTGPVNDCDGFVASATCRTGASTASCAN